MNKHSEIKFHILAFVAVYFKLLIIFVPITFAFCGKQARNNLKNELDTACSICFLCLLAVETTEWGE